MFSSLTLSRDESCSSVPLVRTKSTLSDKLCIGTEKFVLLTSVETVEKGIIPNANQWTASTIENVATHEAASLKFL
jgi:hypothetical protein